MPETSETDFAGNFEYSRRGYQNLEVFLPFMILAVFIPFAYAFGFASLEMIYLEPPTWLEAHQISLIGNLNDSLDS
ncbi:MAG: hypothetical protein WBD20_08140 [Pirellulaceae bacterium]